MLPLSRVDLNLLVVLDAIYTEGGITLAAEKLHLTQPTISHALRRLRDLFNDPLFELQGHRMVPTALTLRVIGPLRESLRSLGGLLSDARDFDPSSSRKHFVIGLPDLMDSTVMPVLMCTVAQEAPDARLSSIPYRRRTLEAGLSSGTMDLAIDVLLPMSENIRFAHIIRDRMVVVARNGHPAIRGSIDLQTYLAQRHVLVTSRPRGPGFEDAELRRLGLDRHVTLRCQHFSAACHAVSLTDLILTMPESHAHGVNRQFDNQILPVPAPFSSLDGYLYWHADNDNDAGNRWLRSVLRRCVGADRL
ncbi:LysR family transcriptional regulator [Variovorax sp. J22P168]|uniref:LysR family transcriptional regulator n=1 Tax=Variovorax jilinensis TaxID=3053513 RepID=UPI002575F27F|nr:LysR family transcriptional regulator [Variovorax sp. J22P168]MDM0013123.1 LysR family transcriptional regulator [Variovorax sp. J22P168]